MALLKGRKEKKNEERLAPPTRPDRADTTEEEMLRYGDELMEYLERRYPLRRNADGAEVVNRF